MQGINLTIVIILAAIASGLMIASAVLAAQMSGGSWLDYAFSAAQTKDFLYSYTWHDVALHRWVTTHFALAMPIVMAVFAICMLKQAAGSRKYRVLVAMAFCGSLADYGENLVIISLLDGGEAFGLKAILTQVKLALVAPPQAVAIYLFLKQAGIRLLAA